MTRQKFEAISNGIIFYQFWIVMEKTLVKRAPDNIRQDPSCVCVLINYCNVGTSTLIHLTHCGLVFSMRHQTSLVNIGSGIALLPFRRQAFWSVQGGLRVSWILINNFIWYSWKVFIQDRVLKMASAKWWTFCSDLNKLTHWVVECLLFCIL